ncbi:hypothetical protein MMC26_002421 [Xylographa opegraphella]|nr:hypothetical protein [Xylographa opegraphella]
MEDDAMLDSSRNVAAPSIPTFKSTKPTGETISATMRRLSSSAAALTALPPSSPVQSPTVSNVQSQIPSDRLNVTSPAPFQRTSTSSSTGSTERSFTPTLNKRTSLSSLKGGSGVTPPRSPVIRRVPSNLSSTTAMTSRSSLPAPAEETLQSPLITSATVAREHFQQEMRSSDQCKDSEVVVILHDACYGHRFARPRTSKANLNTIVERPERIQATVLGVSTAYVRLGGRHAEGHKPPGRTLSHGFAPNAPFRIQKSSRAVSLISPVVTQVHGTKWMAELKTMCEGAESKLAFNGKELVRPLSSLDDHEERPKLHEGDLYLCAESLNALEGALGGVCDAVDAVFAGTATKRCFVSVRPPGHHCSASYPSGFCWVNNVHVGISHASMVHGLTHAAIIDFDLHHGDGSQVITWAHNAKVAALPKNVPVSKKTSIGYFSLHDINSYPCEWGDQEKVQNASLCLENAHGQTIWNVHLQPWKTEAEFWSLYESRYSVLLHKTRAFLRNHYDKIRSSTHSPKPVGAIFISAGFDASEWESPGMQRHKVNVPTDFYARFTRDIVELADEEGLGVDGRVISVLEGGYSDRALTSGVLGHICGLIGNTEAASPTEARNSLGLEMGLRLGKLTLGESSQNTQKSFKPTSAMVDSRWWSLPFLEQLEAIANPSAPTGPPKKARTGTTTYNSPTQSFTAKMVAPGIARRSFSGSAYGQRSSSSASSRAPTPPLPDVDWITAAHELCKLLIPSDRQVDSCKAEDLNAEATRARRVRQSGVGLSQEAPLSDVVPMQLRDRKAKGPSVRTESDEEKALQRGSRRKTIAGAALSKPNNSVNEISSTQAGFRPIRRRSSVASTVMSIENKGHAISEKSFHEDQSNGQLEASGSRPPSSLSMRPGSSLSTMPALPLPIIKKVRVPSKPKQPQGNMTKKQPAKATVARVPSVSAAPESSLHGDTSISTTASEYKPVSKVQPTTQPDLDHLASGMKKMSIKLNVAQRDDTKPGEGKPKAPPRQPRKSNVGRPKKTPLERPNYTATPTDEHAQIVAAKANSDSIAEHQPVPSILEECPQLHLSQAEPPNGQPQATSAEPTTHDLPSSFVPPNPAAVPAPTDVPGLPNINAAPVSNPSANVTQEFSSAVPTETQPPDSFPPSAFPAQTPSTPKHTKQVLPTFTSTSPIIFGKPSLPTNMIDRISAERPPVFPRHGTDTAPRLEQIQAPSNPTATPAAHVHGRDQHQDQPVDIWSVPDTP